MLATVSNSTGLARGVPSGVGCARMFEQSNSDVIKVTYNTLKFDFRIVYRQFSYLSVWDVWRREVNPGGILLVCLASPFPFLFLVEFGHNSVSGAIILPTLCLRNVRLSIVDTRFADKEQCCIIS